MRRVVADFAIGFLLILLISLVFGNGFAGALLPATAFGVFFTALTLVYRQWEKRQQFR